LLRVQINGIVVELNRSQAAHEALIAQASLQVALSGQNPANNESIELAQTRRARSRIDQRNRELIDLHRELLAVEAAECDLVPVLVIQHRV